MLTVFWGFVYLDLVKFYISKYFNCMHAFALYVCLWLVMSYGCLCTDGVCQWMDVGSRHRSHRPTLDIEQQAKRLPNEGKLASPRNEFSNW